MAGEEFELLQDAFRSNWIAPLGPHVSAFEAEMCEALDSPHAVAVSSGTAALHLALLVLGVKPGDEVWCSTLTFVASAALAQDRARLNDLATKLGVSKWNLIGCVRGVRRPAWTPFKRRRSTFSRAAPP